MTTPTMPPTETEHLQQMQALLGAIIRKASLRADQDPAALEVVDLAEKCEALVKEMVRTGTN